MSELTPQYNWLTQQGPAFGAPGVTPRWTSSVKSAVGTAYAASSRAWYTISHGILNEIYYPTIDRPQIRDMELLVTDGETFFHEDKRDLDHEFSYIDPDALGVRIISRDRGGRYQITKEIINDPHYPVVLMRVKLEGDAAVLGRLKLYALMSPHIDGGGAGNSAGVVDVAGHKMLVAWKDHTAVTLASSCGFDRASVGFVGTSDGFQDLRHNMIMDWEFGSAENGNVAMMGEICANHSRDFTLAIGFGDGIHAALSTTLGTLSSPFEKHLKRFLEQWHRAESPAELARHAMDGGRLLQISHNVILAHEDKTYSGAFIASASIPWGYAKGDDDLGGYHLVWTRDMVQSASALLACGRVDTARRALTYLACTQKPDGSFAQNFWINGTPYWTGIQLDEVAFPIILAWRLWKLDGLGEFDVFPFVERAAGFLVRNAPVTQQERWEENPGYSPSTLAAVISGLICAAELARAHGAEELGLFLEEHADWIESHLDEWTVTEDGVLLPEVKRHYMRIRPPACGEIYAREGCAEGMVRLANREPGEQYEFEAREIIDAGFLELVRYGIRRADDPLIIDSLKVVDHVLKIDTPQGPCWRRYNHDGYGQQKNGGPFEHYGQGRAWPLLTGERAHYELAAGKDIQDLVKTYESFASEGGMLPEQIWDAPDLVREGRPPLIFGGPAGSAQPLVWAHAEYLKLLRSLLDGRVFDRIEAVEKRYAQTTGRRESAIEIFKMRRPISKIKAGKRLRLVSRRHFRVLWTLDGWKTVTTLDSRPIGFPGTYVDIPTEAGRAARLTFTIFWTAENRWEGRNFDVDVQPES
ncbi:glycoside hydrolase family 15 protein [Silvibacterium dinghuense]|uniref:Glucan 1,4-alpha-glucosidase n=1 Tax=Silvibacterium dinghuense TaxID=1560006 RepID=A0A4Q1S9X0_9BACT|nr:glycoside hydrolase family 15 protein [Silvibacterium dinghuense]RXS93725.1 glucan 1,4-alpha-glucosidase [Silvibacterium dinghuense]GGH07140.1 glucan 1,4-alpha-glucosidase [Silvibacterium dinghuense]